MELSALIIEYVSVLTEISYHRRGAKGAECEYFLFAVERPRRNGIADRVI